MLVSLQFGIYFMMTMSVIPLYGDSYKSSRVYTTSESRNERKRKISSKWPEIYSVNLDSVDELHPLGKMRTGQATNSHSCHWVRKLPKHLNMELPAFYSRYTEAYGIPVVGSASVTTEGLRRACYIARAMFASRYDIRQAYYKFSGRVALIADNEWTTSLPEYQNLTNPKEWDISTRGVGATVDVPVSSVGDDNMRCCCGDKYPKEDILIHELAHGIHLLCASFVIPGFNLRLEKAYKTAMKKGKWANTYAATNRREYWAVGAQVMFNSIIKNKMKFGELTVSDEKSLRTYDKALWVLLKEVFPCRNKLVPRCEWKTRCSVESFVLLASTNDNLRSNCTTIKRVAFIGLHACMQLACSLLGHGVAMRGSICRVLKCTFHSDLQLTSSSSPEMVYKQDKLPRLDLAKEDDHMINMNCGKPPSNDRCKVRKSKRTQLGSVDLSKAHCERRGGCYNADKCYYPQQDCLDRHPKCTELALSGACKRNPAYMYRMCQISCDICNLVQKLDLDKLRSHCQDRSEHCASWKKWGECERIPNYMGENCGLSCGHCKVINPLKSDALMRAL